MDRKEKQPGEKLDFDIKTDNWLDDGDYVVSATSVATPAGLTVDSTTTYNSGRVVKVWLSGGTNRIRYKVTTTMTSNAGRIKEKDFSLYILER